MIYGLGNVHGACIKYLIYFYNYNYIQMAETYDQRVKRLHSITLARRSEIEQSMIDFVGISIKQRAILQQLGDKAYKDKFDDYCREFYKLEKAKAQADRRISISYAKELRIDADLMKTYDYLKFSSSSPRPTDIDYIINTGYADEPFESVVFQSYIKYKTEFYTS